MFRRMEIIDLATFDRIPFRILRLTSILYVPDLLYETVTLRYDRLPIIFDKLLPVPTCGNFASFLTDHSTQ